MPKQRPRNHWREQPPPPPSVRTNSYEHSFPTPTPPTAPTSMPKDRGFRSAAAHARRTTHRGTATHSPDPPEPATPGSPAPPPPHSLPPPLPPWLPRQSREDTPGIGHATSGTHPSSPRAHTGASSAPLHADLGAIGIAAPHAERTRMMATGPPTTPHQAASHDRNPTTYRSIVRAAEQSSTDSPRGQARGQARSEGYLPAAPGGDTRGFRDPLETHDPGPPLPETPTQSKPSHVGAL